MEYRLNFEGAVLTGFRPKKATKTLDGEEHEPPKMVLVIEVDLDRISPHMRQIVDLYRFGGGLGRDGNPGIGLDFPERADQQRLWQSQADTARKTAESNGHQKDSAAGKLTGITPIGGKKKSKKGAEART